jgi:circadian clock protein KaiC
MANNRGSIKALPKLSTGITGLDEVTEGGLPAGRPTLIAGNAGCGKTLMAMEFLIKGATEYNEPGVFVAFEETKDDLIQNVASLGYDLNKLISAKKIYIDHVEVERSEIEETGEYDLEGLFIRLNYAIDKIGAKRVVLDTIESLFSGFENTAVLRSELRRLFHWLKAKGVTAIITAERGDSNLTRQGLEEYVSDCVILLDHRVEKQVSTRRLRIVKYRGSTHGSNEYPFLIDQDGISVMPITSLKLEHEVSSRRISSGIKELDVMLGGGYYEGSNILLSGTAGTGKTNVGVYFADAASKQGKKALYIAFEESPQQLIRNASSIGLDLSKHVKKGLLHFESTRTSSQGLEMHLANFYKLIKTIKPSVVVVDPITLFTSLTLGGSDLEKTEFGVSSFVDTWLLLRDNEENGERNRLIYVLKSRGTNHSNQVREFVITSQGIDLMDVYVSDEGMLTGSARISAEANSKAAAQAHKNEVARLERKLKHSKLVTEAKLKSYAAELEMQNEELKSLLNIEDKRTELEEIDRSQLESYRSGIKYKEKYDKKN